jgi:putative transposase
VDQNGTVLDILIQSRRNAKAATEFFGKLLKRLR